MDTIFLEYKDKKKNIVLLEDKKILNIFDDIFSEEDIKYLQKRFSSYSLQIWLNILNIDKIQINGFYEYSYAKIGKKMYIIFRNDIKLYKNIRNLNSSFLKYYNDKLIDKNILIIPKKIITTLKKYVLKLDYEVSGEIKYNPILISKKFSWKLLENFTPLTKNGENDNVDPIFEKVTFHTHPYQTYIKKNVKIAWPSIDDYIVIYNIGKLLNKIVYHLVPSVEGIYIIIYNPRSKITENYIKKYFDISYGNNTNNKIFLQTVNKNKKLKTIFFKWDDEIICIC